MARLNEFYVVTHSGISTSVYRVQAQDGSASATKIALLGDSSVRVGEKIGGEGMILAIGKELYGCEPDEHNPPGRARHNSSIIVGLFKNEEEGAACFHDKNLQACDERWLASTQQVLAEIGTDHPSIFVFKDAHHDLLETA